MRISRPVTIIAALLLVVVIAAVWLLKGDPAVSIVEEIEVRASRALGTRVDITDSQIAWSEGRASLSGVSVANPGGFSQGDMIKIDKVEIRGNLADRVVEKISFQGVAAAIEFRGSNSNFETLSDRIEDPPDSGSGAAPAAEPGEKTGEGEENEGKAAREREGEWTVRRVEFGPIEVSVSADWTSRTVALETGGLSVEGLEGDGERLARAAAIEFLSGVLDQAAARADDDRLRGLLQDKAEEVRQRMPGTE